MKKNNRKKGFSLIELIVVIAVIAAIAAVIVPTIGNFSASATENSERRNVQLWAATYQQALAAGAVVATPENGNALAAIDATISVGGQDVRFAAPAVALTAGTVAVDETSNPPSVTYVEP